MSPSIPGPQLARRWQLPGWCSEHGSGRGAEGASLGTAGSAQGWGGVGVSGVHSPMRLKLSDKVLLNFFILPIFSLGCGSMRSHIWAARGPGNFAKLVQRAAQTTARARGNARGRRRLVLLLRLLAGRGRHAALGRLRGSGLGRGWARGGVLGGAGGGRHPRRPGGAAPRRRPPHSPSFVRQSGAAAAAG